MIGLLLGTGDSTSGGGGTGPVAPPSSVAKSTYGGGFAAITWVNGDASAVTEIGYASADAGPDEPTDIVGSATPGATRFETHKATSYLFWARHRKDSINTDWVGGV